MIKIKIKYFVLGGVLFGPIFSILLLSFRGVLGKPDQNYMAIENATKGVHCPDGATMEYGPWGESGRMAKCQIAHGVFIAAEHGHVVVQREYAMGKLIDGKKTQ